MIDISNFVFFDIETTGLTLGRHKILELAYAIGNDDPIILSGPWGVKEIADADPAALRVNKWLGRIPRREFYDADYWQQFMIDIAGKTLVGANPGFDRAFIELQQGYPLLANYRLFDVQAFAAGRSFAKMLDEHGMFTYQHEAQEIFDAWVKFPSLKDLCIGFNVEPGDHTAAGDVRATREVWKKLVGLA